jgi:hypothetical protein
MYGACKINNNWPDKDIFLHLHIDYVVPRQAETSCRRGKIRSRRSVKNPRGKYRFNKSGEYWLINPGNLVGIHKWRQGLESFTFRLLIKDTQAWDIFYRLFVETKSLRSQRDLNMKYLKIVTNLAELLEFYIFCFGWVRAEIVSKFGSVSHELVSVLTQSDDWVNAEMSSL